ncbi:metallophosphoesterase family protein [Yoonia sp.]|uniref:metallophosphoesterase family protein n=1 Tax=Yoonia sp. TaxID=2212373 RepID=UPI003F6BC260
MKILAFSDLHHGPVKAAAIVEAAKSADLVIGAGDFCNHRKGLEDAMAMLEGIKCPFVVVPGNAESIDELRAATDPLIDVLHGQSVDVDGFDIFGIGYAIPLTPFGSWSCDMTETQAEAILERCEKADIIVSHSPPKGVADQTSAGLSVGSTALRDAIVRLSPKFVFCGHVHDSWGQSGTIGRTKIHNLGPTPNWFEM